MSWVSNGMVFCVWNKMPCYSCRTHAEQVGWNSTLLQRFELKYKHMYKLVNDQSVSNHGEDTVKPIYLCVECEREFYAKEHLFRHSLVHKACVYCGKTSPKHKCHKTTSTTTLTKEEALKPYLQGCTKLKSAWGLNFRRNFRPDFHTILCCLVRPKIFILFWVIYIYIYVYIGLTLTRQIWGIWKLRPAYSPEMPNLGQNRWCFVSCDPEIWWMTLENNRASLLCCFKLCATFHSHWWNQTGVTVRKRPIWVKFDDF